MNGGKAKKKFVQFEINQQVVQLLKVENCPQKHWSNFIGKRMDCGKGIAKCHFACD